ncbi:hypothetical protein CPC16_009521 [Podila verticillata]|nr:hypothetical protein CPC16_009521 [Podila verticillata]
MKTSFVVAALALVASVSAQTSTDLDLGTKWCQAFTNGCTLASNSICGANNVPHPSCQSTFNNGKCTGYVTKCSCTTAAGVLTAANTSAMKNTFAATTGTCADLPVRQIQDNSTFPTTTGATPTPTGTTPEKGNAGKTAASVALSVAAAVAAAALAL